MTLSAPIRGSRKDATERGAQTFKLDIWTSIPVPTTGVTVPYTLTNTGHRQVKKIGLIKSDQAKQSCTDLICISLTVKNC